MKFLGATMLLTIVLVVPFQAGGSDCAFPGPPPEYDPWLYQDSSLRFILPDKVQHFYGSYFLADRAGVVPALVAGLAKEFYDQGAGVGFSRRDLVADALGVLASQLNNRSGARLWLAWSDSSISFHLSIPF